MPKIYVGLCGNKGAGKNTVSKILRDKLSKTTNCTCYEIAFADPVKEVCSSVFGWEYRNLLGDTIESREWREKQDEFWSKKLGREFTPRMALQLVGTDLFRNHFDENIWINSLEANVNKIYESNNAHQIANVFFMVPDTRFSNEIDFIRKNNGIIIEVKRNTPSWYNDALSYNTTKESDLPESLKNVHPSEYSYVGCNPDFTIDNTCDISYTEKQVEDIINELIKGGNYEKTKKLDI